MNLYVCRKRTVAKGLDITITFAYRISYDKEIEKNDNVIGIGGKKTALQSG